ncbi:GerAB/ArcD/ProY family transporter [Cohnella silvisoli]|uniref:GerAB/ArcD/ProY family transporter n=1 Tax=Cohnella silvisoli TaxID=2873699 RepID=A0ABV1KM81_9BACL|nr:GerAB/ArcD/ProY family transporter [Cohnella silvisoli]MCD9020464.1 spore germination protein [Cohnella silvisoli]
MRSTLTPNQAAVLFFIFLTGSSIINIPAPLILFSHNGAWISLIATGMFGLLLLIPIVSLARRYPGMTFIQYTSKLMGKPAAIFLGVIFLSYQIQMAAGIVMDIAMFLKSSMMRSTDYSIFIIFSFLAIAITIRVGVGKFVGMFGLLMLSVMVFIVFNVLLSSANFNWHFLLPVVDDGVKPILHGIYFISGFPYGEIVLFSMILPFVKPQSSDRTGRKMALALLLNTASLLMVTLATLLTFGPIAGERKYSMFEVARTIEITEIFQRIEALMGYSLIVASFMKASIVLFTSHITLNHLLGLPHENRQLIFPLALLCAIISISVGIRGEANWNFIVSGINPLWGLAAFVIPIVLVYFVSLLRKKKT